MKIRELKALIADMDDDAVVALRSVGGEAIVFGKEDGDLYDIVADIDTSAGEPEDDLLVLRVGLSAQEDDGEPLPAWATRDGAKRDIDALYGWSNSHYGRYSQATDDEVVAIAADQRMWDEAGRTGPYPHKELS